MTARRATAVAILRAWNGGTFGFAALLGLAAFLLVPSHPVPVPGREGVRSLLWPLVPTLPAVAVPGCLSAGHRDLERVAARSLLRMRAACVSAIAVATFLVCLASWRFDPVVVWRNAALLLGIAFAGTAVHPAVSWLLVSVIPMVMWLTGTQPGGVVEPWCVLLLPRGSALAAWLACLAFALGAAVACCARLGGTPRPWMPALGRAQRRVSDRRGRGRSTRSLTWR